jgi:hypothetical protein
MAVLLNGVPPSSRLRDHRQRQPSGFRDPAPHGWRDRGAVVHDKTMAIPPWLIALLFSLIAITLIPELTLWLPCVAGLVK